MSKERGGQPRPTSLMSASSYVARINFRNRWRSDAGVALLLALTAGLSLFSFAGARRVQSAYPRFLRSANGATLTVGLLIGSDRRLEATVAALPQVTRSLSFIGVNGFVRAPGRPTLTSKDQEVLGTIEPVRLDRFTATTGRLARPSRADEIVVNEFAARRLGYRVGERVGIDVYSTEQLNQPGLFDALPRPKFTQGATVVGIGVFPDEVLQDDGDRTSRVLLTPALTKRTELDHTYALESLMLRRGDADVASVKQRIATLVGGETRYRVRSVDTYHAQQAVRPLTIALALFGAITGVAAILLACLALRTRLRAAVADRAVLAAQGMTHGQIARVVAVGPVVSVLAGVALAVMLAFLASPLMPIGPVRRVEPHRGFSADLTVLGFGAVLMIAVLFAFITVAAWRSASYALAVRRRGLRRSHVPNTTVTAGLPTTGVVGLQLAFNPVDSRSTASTSSVVVGTAIAVAALIGAITFGASLQTLVREPHLYGWNWNAALLSANGYDNIDLAKAHKALDRDPNIAAWSGAYFGAAPIDGTDVPLLGMNPGSRVVPPVLDGRTPRDDTEIVLGARVARRLHKHVGDTVTFTGRGGRHQLTVVGISTFPTLGKLHVEHPSLGVGALVPPSLVPGSDTNIFGETSANLGPNVIFVRYRPGMNAPGELARLRKETLPLVSFAGFDALPVQRPAEIVNAGSTGNAPVVLALSLAIGAVVSLALALAYAVRRRRRELMVLKVLGFTRRQVAATVWWQASTTMLIALVVGIPIGALAGRLLWTTFAHALDVVAAPDVPVLTILGVGVAALVVANLIALPSARAATRFEAANVLRSE
jgi:ABC-type lipoprotein release transport system permease subunit